MEFIGKFSNNLQIAQASVGLINHFFNFNLLRIRIHLDKQLGAKVEGFQGLSYQLPSVQVCRRRNFLTMHAVFKTFYGLLYTALI